jgi:hypothetical protein
MDLDQMRELNLRMRRAFERVRATDFFPRQYKTLAETGLGVLSLLCSYGVLSLYDIDNAPMAISEVEQLASLHALLLLQPNEFPVEVGGELPEASDSEDSEAESQEGESGEREDGESDGESD